MYDKLIPKGIYGVFGETSEITGGEHICKERAINEKIGEKWYKVWKAYQDDVIEAHKVDDLSESQPTKGNIEGGLSTIEEKATGQPRKNRPQVPLYRRARAGRSAGEGARASTTWTRHRLRPNASR